MQKRGVQCPRVKTCVVDNSNMGVLVVLMRSKLNRSTIDSYYLLLIAWRYVFVFGLCVCSLFFSLRRLRLSIKYADTYSF